MFICSHGTSSTVSMIAEVTTATLINPIGPMDGQRVLAVRIIQQHSIAQPGRKPKYITPMNRIGSTKFSAWLGCQPGTWHCQHPRLTNSELYCSQTFPALDSGSCNHRPPNARQNMPSQLSA